MSRVRQDRIALPLLALNLVGLGFLFASPLATMVQQWGREEYSHGYLIPLVAAFLAWRVRGALGTVHAGTAWGVAVLLGGLAIGLLGDLATLYTVMLWGFWLCLAGLGLSFIGWRGMRSLWAPLAYLLFMMPLPNVLYRQLSSELQLWSSSLGVAVMRIFDIPVLLEGNLIDLGVYQLQVAEACSGLRYLFPLMSFGFLCAYLYAGRWWERTVVFLSTLPITVLMNGLRVGLVGVLVAWRGSVAAEGFMHLFEGWLVFLGCLALLLLEMSVLAWLVHRRSVWALLRLEAPPRAATHPASAHNDTGALPGWRQAWAATACVVLTLAASAGLGARPAQLAQLTPLADLSLAADGWQARPGRLPPAELKVLEPDDYLLADLEPAAGGPPVTVYVAYYASQRRGTAVHSPQACLPGSGWRMESLHTAPVVISAARPPHKAIRALIRRGADRQLVYYWFRERDRVLTNEYAVKWFLLWDGLTRNRTNGALIRFTTPLGDTEDPATADRRLARAMQHAVPRLDARLGS